MTKIIDFSTEYIQNNFATEVKNLANSRFSNPTAAIITFGCQQNESDSEKISGLCELMGFNVLEDVKITSENLSNADLIIINTCAIREHAELKALSNTGRLKNLKEENPSLIIGMCGCMVQAKHRFEQIKRSYSFVNFMLGTDGLFRLPEVVLSVLKEGKRQYFVSTDLSHNELGRIEENLPTIRSSKFKSWLPIIYGCNNFCTYCVVPSVRGHERSRSEDSIIEEFTSLVETGCKEITLLGQNVNSYNGEKGGFTDLLNSLLEIDGDFRIRFMTSHPKDASEELISLLSHSKMASHFHLPVQSGSNKILSAMNRKYTRDDYLYRANLIREDFPDCSITTDIICGFPDETDRDFEDTLDIIKTIEFDMIYTFLYSPRKNTPAFSYENQIPQEIKAQRMKELTELANFVSEKRNKNHINEYHKVLLEKNKDSKGFYFGRNSQNKLVKFKTKEKESLNIGEFVDVLIKDGNRTSLIGIVE